MFASACAVSMICVIVCVMCWESFKVCVRVNDYGVLVLLDVFV